MKLIKAYWERAISWSISSLLTLLGFSSCEWFGSKEDDPQIYMYGTPTSYYQIKGKVTNEAGKPLAGIQVSVPRTYFGTVDIPGRILDDPRGYEELKDTLRVESDTLMVVTDRKGNYVSIAPLKTSMEGQFEIISTHFPMDTLRYDLIFNDVNDPPVYATDSVQVTFVAKDLEGGDEGWNRGKIEKEITVVLKSKGGPGDSSVKE